MQLSYLRYPGVVLGIDELPFAPLLHLIAGQLKVPVEHWAEYGERAQTRREHLVELQTFFGFTPFTTTHHKLAVQELTETAMQTDKGAVLAASLIEKLRQRAILLPRLTRSNVCARSDYCDLQSCLAAPSALIDAQLTIDDRTVELRIVGHSLPIQAIVASPPIEDIGLLSMSQVLDALS